MCAFIHVCLYSGHICFDSCMRFSGRPCYPFVRLRANSKTAVSDNNFHWHVQYVLARIFGTSGVLFEREEEQQIFAAVAHAGLGPKLLVRHLS